MQKLRCKEILKLGAQAGHNLRTTSLNLLSFTDWFNFVCLIYVVILLFLESLSEELDLRYELFLKKKGVLQANIWKKTSGYFSCWHS